MKIVRTWASFKVMCLGVLGAGMLHAAQASDVTRYALETDPATFLWNGYAAHLRVAPAATPHWVFGLGAYALDLPDPMVAMTDANKDQGWAVRLRQGVGLFSEYYLATDQQGWFVGGQLAHQEYRLRNDDYGSDQVTYAAMLLMAHAGYRWYPAGEHFYIQPWAGAGMSRKVSGDNSLQDKTYKVAPLLSFMTVHMGYRF